MRSCSQALMLSAAIGIGLSVSPAWARDSQHTEPGASGPVAGSVPSTVRGTASSEARTRLGNVEAQSPLRPFTLSMKVRLAPRTEVGWRSLKPGDTARSGDGFTVTTWADQPVYLYIVDYQREGWSSLLFPTAQHTQVRDGETIQLPGRGGQYRLNQQTGELVLLAYASNRPLDEKGCALLRLSCPLWSRGHRSRGDSSEQKEAPPPPPPPPPAHPPAGPAGPTDRSPTTYESDGDHVISITSGEEGTALLPFRFLHAL